MSKHIIIWHSNIKDDDEINVYSQDPSYVVVAKRTDLNNLKKIEESNQPGIYILLDKFNKRYIGQASHSVINRLSNHEKNKTWWDSIIFFGRDDGKVDKSQLDYLEKKIIQLYTESGFILDNADIGNKSFIEVYQRGRAESLWENTLQILEDTANIKLFKKSRVSVNHSSAPSKETIESGIKNPNSEISPKFILTDSLGNEIKSKSNRQMYFQWIAKLCENNEFKQKFYELMTNGSKSFRREEIIDKNNKKWTWMLSDDLHLFVNLDSKTIYKRIEEIAQKLNITYTII